MKISSFVVLATFLFSNVAYANAAQTSPPTLVKTAFDYTDVHGTVSYSATYRVASHLTSNTSSATPWRRVWLNLTVSKPAPLWCLDYRDFKITLKDSSGKVIPSAPRLTGSVVPEVGFEGLNTGTSTCAFDRVLRRDVTVDFLLDSIFPNLPVGTYKLSIALKPTDVRVPSAEFPPVSFSVTD